MADLEARMAALAAEAAQDAERARRRAQQEGDERARRRAEFSALCDGFLRTMTSRGITPVLPLHTVLPTRTDTERNRYGDVVARTLDLSWHTVERVLLFCSAVHRHPDDGGSRPALGITLDGEVTTVTPYDTAPVDGTATVSLRSACAVTTRNHGAVPQGPYFLFSREYDTLLPAGDFFDRYEGEPRVLPTVDEVAAAGHALTVHGPTHIGEASWPGHGNPVQS